MMMLAYRGNVISLKVALMKEGPGENQKEEKIKGN